MYLHKVQLAVCKRALSRLAISLASVVLLLPLFLTILPLISWADDISGLQLGSESHPIIVGSSDIEIEDDGDMFISLAFNYSKLDPRTNSIKLISKYEAFRSPFNGWAVRVKSFKSSVRPQLYLKDSSGKGGWHSFAAYDFQPKKWYELHLVFQKRRSATCYICEIDFDVKSRCSFLGGRDLSYLGETSTGSDIILGSISWQDFNFDGTVAKVLVGFENDLESNIFDLLSTLNKKGRIIAKDELERYLLFQNKLLTITGFDDSIDVSVGAKAVFRKIPSRIHQILR